MTRDDESTDIHVAIRRFDPEADEHPRWQEFSVTVRPGMTVLEVLTRIREEQDATLAWRSSCRMGICGACGMVINGVPRLACNTQVLEIGRRGLRIEPLWNFDIVKDLVADQAPMFDAHAAVQPYLLRDDDRDIARAGSELQQSPAALLDYLQFSYCIKCGLCMAACPTVATDRGYLGPMPLTAAQRYNADTRNQGMLPRRDLLEAPGGAFHCHFAGECSRVCPKGVDPARAIQLLKRNLLRSHR